MPRYSRYKSLGRIAGADGGTFRLAPMSFGGGIAGSGQQSERETDLILDHPRKLYGQFRLCHTLGMTACVLFGFPSRMVCARCFAFVAESDYLIQFVAQYIKLRHSAQFEAP